MAAVGLRGPALAFVGRRWLPWAFVGLHWPSVVVVGCYGPLLSIKWKEKIEKETHLGPKRRQTRRLGPFSSSWAFVGRHWLPNGYCGPSWACVGLRHLRVVWARCPSSSIATRHCSLFVVVVNIYELVKRINKRKKTYLRAQSFDMFESFGPTARHPSSSPPL